ncbi:MAG: amino acid permease [Sphingomicrobium sp.]
MTNHTKQPQMMGVWMTTGLVVGSMIGSGIFLLPVSLAPLGANMLIAWIVSILGALSVAFALSRLARLGGNGMQSYIEQAFGPFAGYLVGWAFWFSNWVSVAAVAIAFGSAMTRLVPSLGTGSVNQVAVASIVVLTAINALGVRMSGGFNLVTVAVRLIPLIGVALLLAFLAAQGGALQPIASTPITLNNVATATTLTLFAMLGFENATAPVGKVRNPERTLPIAILGGTALVGLVYLVSSSGVALLLPASALASSPAPYADVFASYGGSLAVIGAAFCIAVAAFGSNNCLVLATGELAYAMAARGQLPAVMARTTAIGTPVIAQFVSGVLSIAAVLANTSRTSAGLFVFLILLSTSGILIIYAAGTLAAWREDRSRIARGAMLLALLFVAFAFYGAGIEANLWCLVLLAAGGVNYLIMHRLNSRGVPSPAVATDPPAPRE